MKKILFFMFLFIAAAGAVLYFGWIQIPENKSALFFSSITGYEENLLETGKFHWRWQKLIPRTSKTFLINTAPEKAEIRLDGKLPSADAYSVNMPGKPDFSYALSADAVYTLKQDYIAERLVKGLSASGDEESSEITETVYAETGRKIENVLRSEVEKSFTDKTGSFSDNRDFLDKMFSSERLSSLIQESVEGIELKEFGVTRIVIPDINLYRAAVKIYEDIVSGKKQQLLESEMKSAVYDSELRKRLETLEKYGEILTKYPILLEYLKINPEGDILNENIMKQERQ